MTTVVVVLFYIVVGIILYKNMQKCNNRVRGFYVVCFFISMLTVLYQSFETKAFDPIMYFYDTFRFLFKQP